jgi:hypothetical protein
MYMYMYMYMCINRFFPLLLLQDATSVLILAEEPLQGPVDGCSYSITVSTSLCVYDITVSIPITSL